MLKRQQGFILLTVIVLLASMTLLSLSLLQAVQLFLKVSYQSVVTYQASEQLEAFAHTWMPSHFNSLHERCYQAEAPCITKQNNKIYHYRIHEVGVYPCLIIQKNEQSFASQHFLVTVSTKALPGKQLQVRIAKPILAGACKSDLARDIHAGVLNWRYMEAGS